MLNRHCASAYHVICTPYVKFKYIFQFLTPTLPIHYVTFIELRWRIRGVLSVTSNVKGQNERKISKSKNLQNFDLLGALEIRGYEKLQFLLQKAHPCVNARRLSHFASKSVGRSDLQRWAGKKSQKVTRGSHRNDVSPLTQGLRYRAACDVDYDCTHSTKKQQFTHKASLIWLILDSVRRTVVVSMVCVRDVCECALISVPKSTTSSSSSFDNLSTTAGAVRLTCRDWVRTVAAVTSDEHRDGCTVICSQLRAGIK